jgi:hypothetical protein
MPLRSCKEEKRNISKKDSPDNTDKNEDISFKSKKILYLLIDFPPPSYILQKLNNQRKNLL